jgi:two-component system, LytTR family, sensor histidine kinase AlgZ
MDTKTIIKDQGFLPNFCDVSVVFVLALLVELFAMVLAIAPADAAGFWERLALISLFAQWVALVNAAFLCGLRKWLNQLSVPLNTVICFTIMMSVSLFFSLAIIFFGHYIGLYALTNNDWLIYFLFRNMVISGVIYAVVLRYLYIHHQWVLNIHAQSHAQIHALKARIRPHFLFNSMNTIACLISIDAKKAEKAVEDLSDLFRASLQEKTRHSLADEIALTRSYVDIEHLRLGDRLQVDWIDENSPKNMEIPALCLQPIVENAIYHGIEPLTEGGIIKIKTHIQNNLLCLSVSNPISTHGGMTNRKSNHMAQDNIRKRLSLTYGDAAAFEINEQQETYTVSLKIPLKQLDT